MSTGTWRQFSNRASFWFLLCGSICGLTLPQTEVAASSLPAYQVIYAFNGGQADGGNPGASLFRNVSGALYGTTELGGGNACDGVGCGTIFELTPPNKTDFAWSEAAIYRFSGKRDGFLPEAAPILSNDGKLFVTAPYGGPGVCPDKQGCGAIVELTPPSGSKKTWEHQVLHTFTGDADGGSPTGGSLILDKTGAVYGTTYYGGSGTGAGTSRYGVAFKFSPPTAGHSNWTETVLYNFCSLQGCADGYGVYAGLLADASGALYGATQFAGGGNCFNGAGCGLIYKLTPSASQRGVWTETHLFGLKGGAAGTYPNSTLVADKTGALYGTTTGGGRGKCSIANGALTGCGVVFKLTPPSSGRTQWTATILHRFAGDADGGNPHAGVILDAEGSVYGVTGGGGGSGCGGTGCGIIYKLVPSRTIWKETVLHRFCQQAKCIDGGIPNGTLVADKSGVLYGTTYTGGKTANCLAADGKTKSNCGTVFSLSGSGFKP